MREENLVVHLVEGVRLIWGPLNTGFVVVVREPVGLVGIIRGE